MSVSRVRVEKLPEGSQRKISLDEVNEGNPLFTPYEQRYIKREKEFFGIPAWGASVEEWEDYQWEKHLREKFGIKEDLSRTLGPLGIFRSIYVLYNAIFGVCRKRAKPVSTKSKKNEISFIKKKLDNQWKLGPYRSFSTVHSIPMYKPSDTDKPSLSMKFSNNGSNVPHRVITRNEPLKRPRNL